MLNLMGSIIILIVVLKNKKNNIKFWKKSLKEKEKSRREREAWCSLVARATGPYHSDSEGHGPHSDLQQGGSPSSNLRRGLVILVASTYM